MAMFHFRTLLSLAIFNAAHFSGTPISAAADARMDVAGVRLDPSTALWYDQPAAQWIEALPLGNGRLGAMFHGGTASERIVLNDITVWSGGPQPDANRPDGWEHLAEIRQAIREGRYKDAEGMCDRFLTCRANYDENKFQMLADLNFAFELPAGQVGHYRRWLDLQTAQGGVEFEVGGVTFRRELFCSAADKVLVQRLTASQPGALSFTIRLSRPEKASTRFEPPSTLVLTGSTGRSLDFQANARVEVKGGRVTGEGDTVKVEGGDRSARSCHRQHILCYGVCKGISRC